MSEQEKNEASTQKRENPIHRAQRRLIGLQNEVEKLEERIENLTNHNDAGSNPGNMEIQHQ
jgi:peptidoglycan hydrolase CwlO-like protein